MNTRLLRNPLTIEDLFSNYQKPTALDRAQNEFLTSEELIAHVKPTLHFTHESRARHFFQMAQAHPKHRIRWLQAAAYSGSFPACKTLVEEQLASITMPAFANATLAAGNTKNLRASLSSTIKRVSITLKGESLTDKGLSPEETQNALKTAADYLLLQNQYYRVAASLKLTSTLNDCNPAEDIFLAKPVEASDESKAIQQLLVDYIAKNYQEFFFNEAIKALGFDLSEANTVTELQHNAKNAITSLLRPAILAQLASTAATDQTLIRAKLALDIKQKALRTSQVEQAENSKRHTKDPDDPNARYTIDDGEHKGKKGIFQQLSFAKQYQVRRRFEQFLSENPEERQTLHKLKAAVAAAENALIKCKLVDDYGRLCIEPGENRLLQKLNTNPLQLFILLIDNNAPTGEEITWQQRNTQALYRAMQAKRFENATVARTTKLQSYTTVLAAISGSGEALKDLANPLEAWNPLLAQGITPSPQLAQTAQALSCQEYATAAVPLFDVIKALHNSGLKGSIFEDIPARGAHLLRELHPTWASENENQLTALLTPKDKVDHLLTGTKGTSYAKSSSNGVSSSAPEKNIMALV